MKTRTGTISYRDYRSQHENLFDPDSSPGGEETFSVSLGLLLLVLSTPHCVL